MVYVQFRTRDWDDFGYKDFGNYARVAIFPENLRPADPWSPGVVGFAPAISREVAAPQQHISNFRRQVNGQGNEQGASDRTATYRNQTKRTAREHRLQKLVQEARRVME